MDTSAKPSQYEDDVAIARAALHGDEAAISALEVMVEQAGLHLVRFRLTADESDEVLQRLRVRLLVGGEKGRPALGNYAGEGALGAFVRVVAVRITLNFLARERPNNELQLEAVPEFVLGVGCDPAIEALKASCCGTVEKAIADGWGALGPEQMLLLQHYLLDALTIDDLAGLYDVHRATAARRIVSAKDRWVQNTREILKTSLTLTSTEVDSLLHLVESQVQIDLPALEVS